MRLVSEWVRTHEDLWDEEGGWSGLPWNLLICVLLAATWVIDRLKWVVRLGFEYFEPPTAEEYKEASRL